MTQKYDGLDTFISGVGTVRECIDCAAIIRGGPTRCIQCTKTWVRVANRVFNGIEGAYWSLYWRSRTMRKLVSVLLPGDGDPRI